MRERVLETIYAAIDDNNRQFPEYQVAKAEDTVLFGEGGALDSLGLVHLIVGVEQRVEEDFGAAVALADERAMAQEQSPFRTVGALADYVTTLLREHGSS